MYISMYIYMYSEFHVNNFTILSLIATSTLSTDVTKSLQCGGIFF